MTFFTFFDPNTSVCPSLLFQKFSLCYACTCNSSKRMVGGNEWKSAEWYRFPLFLSPSLSYIVLLPLFLPIRLQLHWQAELKWSHLCRGSIHSLFCTCFWIRRSYGDCGLFWSQCPHWLLHQMQFGTHPQAPPFGLTLCWSPAILSWFTLKPVGCLKCSVPLVKMNSFPKFSTTDQHLHTYHRTVVVCCNLSELFLFCIDFYHVFFSAQGLSSVKLVYQYNAKVI